jgi:hypothetical protein
MKRVTSSKTFAYSDRATGALYIPAHPQGHSFLRLSWGALSVPRKNLLLPLVTAETIACPRWGANEFYFIFISKIIKTKM